MAIVTDAGRRLGSTPAGTAGTTMTRGTGTAPGTIAAGIHPGTTAGIVPGTMAMAGVAATGTEEAGADAIIPRVPFTTFIVQVVVSGNPTVDTVLLSETVPSVLLLRGAILRQVPPETVRLATVRSVAVAAAAPSEAAVVEA